MAEFILLLFDPVFEKSLQRFNISFSSDMKVQSNHFLKVFLSHLLKALYDVPESTLKFGHDFFLF